MELTRSSGILAHPTSFPGRYGIGELGQETYNFIDWLSSAGQKWWQVMPLGPTGYGDSPYQSFSAFAGNPYLISLDTLRDDGLLLNTDLEPVPDFGPDKVDFGWLYTWKFGILEKAYAHFTAGKNADLALEFEVFKQQEAAWLEDYTLFMAVKGTQDTVDPFGHPCKGAPWNEWPQDIRSRQPEAMQRYRAELLEVTDRFAFYQFLFFRQWSAVREYTKSKGIRIIGDIPIFVAMDSSDAWANPGEFLFDEGGQPTVVAGVPPDYFSETGQLWGNPLYRWDKMQHDGFAWWLERFRGSLKLYDLIRVDHFRGFEAYWEVGAGEETAVKGRWVKAPGKELFEAVKAALGDLPIIAEDLGVITPEVEALRDGTGYPGMAVLHFAFAGGEDWSENSFLPENLRENQVVYTGTHDNDTTRGWFMQLEQAELEHLRKYIPDAEDDKIAWQLLELAWRSRADLAIAPLQDVMNLGTEARMNLPGRLGDNWEWRFKSGVLSSFTARRLKALTQEVGR